MNNQPPMRADLMDASTAPGGDRLPKTLPSGHDDESLFHRDPWRWWRDQMPITDRFAYFDHAAVGPITRPASQWIQRFADQACQLGDTVWPSWNQKLQTLRTDIAAMIGGQVEDFFIVPNTTSGINTVAEGWDWRPGDNVVLPEGEFPSNLFPWLNQRSKGVEVRLVPRRGGRIVHVDDLMSRVDANTQMIAVSWVGFATGYRIDLDRLVHEAHRRGVKVFVDAIQGLGVYELDLRKTPIDFLAADGHKWLLGPEGVGIAMIRRQHFDRIRVGNVGWASVKDSNNYSQPELTLREDARRFESGSANMVGVGALSASVEMFRKIQLQYRTPAIADRVLGLASMLRERLGAAGAETSTNDPVGQQSGIINFQIPGTEPAAFQKHALAHDVVLSVRGGGIRAAVHAYNNQSDIERLISAVQERRG